MHKIIFVKIELNEKIFTSRMYIHAYTIVYACIYIVYYINSRILCVCPSVCVFVTSEISATGRRSDTLLSPTWRASPDELCQLVVQLVRPVVREKKPLELFRR